MALCGYARVSTSEQDLILQTKILRAAGCEIIRAEKASGSSRPGRSELQLLLAFMWPGDTLMMPPWIAWPIALRTCRISYRP